MNMPANPDQLSAQIFRFLVDHIDSVPELEALLLFQDNPARQWTSDELAGWLYVSPRSAAAILAKLQRQGWIVEGSAGAYRFCTDTAEASLIEHLSRAYARHLTLVARVIHEKPAIGIREFARAFKVKG